MLNVWHGSCFSTRFLNQTGKTMRNLLLGTIAVVGMTASAAQAAVLTVQGDSSGITGNCIPFGCPGSYGPYQGFIYQNLPAFTLNVGDKIAFDSAGVNNTPLSFNIFLSSTTTNGGTNPVGFTQVVNNGTAGSVYGDNALFNYDLTFTFQNAFSFSGGGLIIGFQATGAAANDTSWIGNLVGTTAGDSPDKFVGRYYAATTLDPSTGGQDGGAIGNFQLVMDAQPQTPVPEPASMALLGAGLLGLAGLHRRRQQAAA
jgi:hypothetical protein